MADIIQWFDAFFGAMPGLTWLKFVFAGVFLMVVLDAILNLILGSISSLFKGR